MALGGAASSHSGPGNYALMPKGIDRSLITRLCTVRNLDEVNLETFRKRPTVSCLLSRLTIFRLLLPMGVLPTT